MSLDIGLSNLARAGDKGWVGVNNVAREIDKMWIGVNGIAREFYSGFTKRFVHRYRPQYGAVYARSSEDFASWTEAVKLGSTFYGNDFAHVNFGGSKFAYSLLFNGKYYFINTNGTFQYTEDGINFTTVAESHEPVTSDNQGRCITVIDGKFYAVYKHIVNSTVTISIYTSMDLLTWTLVTSFTSFPNGYTLGGNFGTNSLQMVLFKGMFRGKVQYALFYNYTTDTKNSGVLVSDDCVSWDWPKNSNGNALSISWSNVCIAEDGIYYTSKFVTNDTKWNMYKPDGTIMSISGLDTSGLAQYYQPYFIESIFDKDYLLISVPSRTTNLYKVHKSGGSAVKIATDQTGVKDGSWNIHRLLGTCTKLTTTTEESSYAKAGYCSAEGEWTWVSVSASSATDNSLIYD